MWHDTQKAFAAKCGHVGKMQWVNNETFSGPDRRHRKNALRLHERRREDSLGSPPALTTAMRQLRQHILDAHGAEAAAFRTRALGLAALAAELGETAVAAALERLADIAAQGEHNDVRDDLHAALDQAQLIFERAR